VVETITTPVDCACVIHGTAYDWTYVERLYNMLNRHITQGIRLHVYTEADRPVPEPMIKHVLTDWGISGPKRAWWYKMQLFNPEHHAGPLLYFDLDTVIIGNLNWLTALPTQHFWGIRDFKHLWKPMFYGVNSSVMYWDTTRFDSVWKMFCQENFNAVISGYHGDQDYITAKIPTTQRRFFPIEQVKSWRWECLDGGYNFKKSRFLQPGTGTNPPESTSILVFHGNPKPDKITDSYIQKHWQ
jgi:hypothetical protein